MVDESSERDSFEGNEALYHRYLDNDNDNDNDEHRIRRQASGAETSPCCYAERLRHWKGRYLAPASPERAPGTWMLINTFMLVWSLSLGSYITLLYWWYRNNDSRSRCIGNGNGNGNGNDFNTASRESTTDYLVWSLLTTLVWVAEISLRAAFPKIDTVLVVFNHEEEQLPDDEEAPLRSCSADGARNEDSREDGMPGARHLFLRSATAETRSVVTIERVVQKRSRKQLAVIVTELLLAVYFGIETVGDCWNFWHSRRSSSRIGDTDDYVYREYDHYHDYDYYYDYDDNDGDGGEFYTMLQQEADVWVSVLAYAYMTYETYHAYRWSTTTQREIERSLSTVSQSQQRRPQRQQRGRAARATVSARETPATAPPLEVMVHGIRPQDPASTSASPSSALSLDPKHKAGKDTEPMATACLAESCSDVTPDEKRRQQQQ